MYVALSLLIEAASIVVGRLKVPADDLLLAPIVLTVPPMLVAWICGYRTRRTFFVAAGSTALLTFVFTVAAGRLTGVSTGLTEPVVVRFLAGLGGAFSARRASQR
jgi:hypothetical protein